MADFNYVVVDNATGRQKKGTMVAKDENEVRSKLKSDGMVVMDISKATALNKEINISIGGGVKPRDLSVFCRQFLSMINAGVTIMEALDMLSDQTENKNMAAAIKGTHGEIQKGETLSDALAKYPKIFPSIMISMVAAGEASGKLDIAFDRMSEHFEKSARMQAMVKKAAMYPILVTIVALVVVVVMLVKVIPSYQDMFEQMGTELPAITQMVVAASHFIMEKWYILIAVIVSVVVGLKVFAQTITGQKVFGTLARKAPVFGPMNVKSAAASFARTLSTLVYSGLPMIEALAITSNTMTNYIYKMALQGAKEEVAKGIPLSEPIANCGLYPSMVSHMISIGEETGDLEGMLSKLADYYDEEVEMATQTMMAALEPMIILVLAGVVGVLVAAIMSPMFAMYQNMDNL